MGLENTFNKVEKVEKEKKLEVITSKENILKDLESYFQKNKYEGFESWEGYRGYLSSCMNFLKSFELTPKIISEFNKKVGSVGEKENVKEALGLYLSALMQTSYNQCHNDFAFEEVNAYSFGAFLKGKAKNPIKITTETLKGNWSLFDANGCLAEIKNYQGECFGGWMEDCTIQSGNEKTLELIENQVRGGVNNRFELKK